VDASNSFADRSNEYAAKRPQYPSDLFDWLASQCTQTQRAWDCATGNGQAAVDLAVHFEQVQATDISSEQLGHARPHERVVYSARTAEDSGFADDSFDLVTVAQALHWFDRGRFWPEIARVTRPGGLFCAWGYTWLTLDRDLERVLLQPFIDTLAPFWSPKVLKLWNGYDPADVQFPFPTLPAPRFAIEVKWTLAQLLGYVHTWSAYKASANDPAARATLDRLEDQARREIGERELLNIRMPIHILAGRV